MTDTEQDFFLHFNILLKLNCLLNLMWICDEHFSFLFFKSIHSSQGYSYCSGTCHKSWISQDQCNYFLMQLDSHKDLSSSTHLDTLTCNTPGTGLGRTLAALLHSALLWATTVDLNVIPLGEEGASNGAERKRLGKAQQAKRRRCSRGMNRGDPHIATWWGLQCLWCCSQPWLLCCWYIAIKSYL